MDTWAQALAECGWAVIDGFLPSPAVREMAGEALALWQSDAFRQAHVGRGAGRHLRPEVRTDHVLWLEPDTATPRQADYLARMEALRQDLNRQFYLGLRDLEAHLALYPPGAFYRRHLDAFAAAPGRTVSAVLYLNQDWTAADGGCLRLYEPAADDGSEVVHDILPEGGRLALFLAQEVEHEVLPARRERLSVTGWFLRD